MNGESQSPLRLWPAWLISFCLVVSVWLSVTPSIPNQPRFFLMVGGPLLSALLISLWVLFASRLKVREKLWMSLIAIALPIVSLLLSYPSEATRSAILIYGLTLAVLAVTIGLSLWSNRSSRVLLTSGLMAVAWGSFLLLRNDGFDGDYYPEFTWRWNPIHEQSLPELEPGSDLGQEIEQEPLWAAGMSWAMFRGPNGNGIVDEPFDAVDWQASPPKEIWRIDVGPGWSSFSYDQGRLFTQEQRLEKELVTCYGAEDGRLLWSHGDESRFEEVVSGAGPRSTPTIAGGRVYAFGARALLSCLEKATGKLIWQRDLLTELEATVPTWAFSGSPLVIDNHVIVYVGGKGDNGLVALDATDGKSIWGLASTGDNYATPRLLTISGVPCLVFCDSSGVVGLDWKDGKQLWKYKPKGWKSAPMVDAQQIDENSLLVALGDGVGMSCLQFEQTDGEWQISELWSSSQLRPSFNDSLVFENLVFGFNQSIYCCIDAEAGKRRWQGGRFGFGQAVLLKNSKTIIVASEKGEAVFLSASGDKLTELARLPVLNDKTWNHPIVVGNRLFMRNAKTAACLQLSP